MVYTVVYRCFHIFTELTFLKGIFSKNGYPENLIDKCFKKFLNIHLVKENVIIVRKKKNKKKRLLIVFPYLGIFSLQIRTKLQYQRRNYAITSCKKKKKFDLSNQYLISVTFQRCFFSSLSSFNDE